MPHRYPRPTTRVLSRPIVRDLYIACTTFPTAAIYSSIYRSRGRAGLDTTLDPPRRTARLARLDRTLGPR